MYQPRNRWLINVVLVLAVIGFVGFSMFPLISSAFKENQSSTIATSASGQKPDVGEKSKLQDQARGYELVLQREPENQTALQGLVQARLQLRDFKEVVAPLEKLAALNPNRTEYKFLLAELKQYNGDYDGAIAIYDQAIEADKQDFHPVLAKALVLKKQGKTEQALPLFKNAAALAPAQYKDRINQAAEEPSAVTTSPTSAPDK